MNIFLHAFTANKYFKHSDVLLFIFSYFISCVQSKPFTIYVESTNLLFIPIK